MIDHALPTLQAAVDALHTRLTAGRVRATGTASCTGLTGPTTDTTPDELGILEAVMGGRWAARMGDIWGRDELHASGASEDDWALESEIAYQAIRRGYTGEALALIVERIMRAGPYRAKWDDPRGRVTWLAQDIANAIATIQKRLSTNATSDEAPEDETAAPADETPAQTIARQDRELRNLRAAHAVLQTALWTTRAQLEQERELRARDRRRTLAEQRLDRCSQFNAGQKAAIKIVALIAPARANSLGVDDPIITRKTVAAVYGAKEETTGGHLKVFDLEGSPVVRVRKPYGTKEVTHYELKTRDPIEIIEKMATLGEQLDKRPSPRQRVRCRTCPEGTGTIVNIICEGCGGLLEERHVAPPKDAQTGNAGKNPPLGESPPTVDVVTVQAEKPRVAGTPDSDELADGRAAAAVAVQTRPPDPSKQPGYGATPECESIGRIPMTCQNGHAPSCPDCPTREAHYRTVSGTARCPDCGHEAPSPSGLPATVRQVAPGVTETVRIGATGAVETIIGRDPSLPTVDTSITAHRSCCGSGVIHQRAGVWACADCGALVTA